jgi:hypothetical protein
MQVFLSYARMAPNTRFSLHNACAKVNKLPATMAEVAQVEQQLREQEPGCEIVLMSWHVLSDEPQEVKS